MKLEDLHKNSNKAQVPENYFESHPDEVLKRIQRQKKYKIISLYTFTSVAAGLALIIGFSIFFKTDTAAIEGSELEFAEHNTYDSYFEYLNDYVNDFELDELVMETSDTQNDELYLEEIDTELLIELL